MRSPRSAACLGASVTNIQMVFSEMSCQQATNTATQASQPPQIMSARRGVRRRHTFVPFRSLIGTTEPACE